MNKKTVHIDIEDLSCAYASHTVIDKLSMQVYWGELLGIVGPNGGGKSSLLKCILGLLPLKEGKITFYQPDGSVCRDANIGYLPQMSRIDRHFPISVCEVIRSGLGLKAKKEASLGLCQQAAERFAVADLLKRPIGKLSGGQLQRVLLARAIVSEPDLIILDEPNSYLDSQSSQLLQESISELRSPDKSIIVVSHLVDNLRNEADRIIEIKSLKENI